MKFIDCIKLHKRVATLLRKRNLLLSQARDVAHPFFSLMPFPYINNFYVGIANDPNTDDVFRSMLQADEASLDSINCTLVFWFFWSMDRLQGFPLLNDPKVRLGFVQVWGLGDTSLDYLIKHFDELPLGQQPLSVWGMISKDLHNTSLSPIFGTIHIRNAQVNTLEQIQKIMGTLPAS